MIARLDNVEPLLLRPEVQESSLPVEEVTADDTAPGKIFVLFRERGQVATQLSLIREQRHAVLSMRARGIARAEVGGDEALDACFDGCVGQALLDVDLGAFDRDDDGVLAGEDGYKVFYCEAVVD